MRRVLMVTYFFPPVGGVGVERSLKHVIYLPERGWEPVVVAPANSSYRIVDPATEARIPPGTEVHRAHGLEPGHLRRLVGRLAGRAASASSSAPASETAPTSIPGVGAAAGPGAPSAARGAAGVMLRRLNAAWAWAIPRTFFPDEQVGWIPGAVAAGRRAAVAGQVDVIYSSSPPISGHMAAALLKRSLKVPWVADFRDPWIGNSYAPPLPRPHRALQIAIERRIVASADRVILPTADLRERYAERYPDLAARFVHIPNGYDLAEIGAIASEDRSEAPLLGAAGAEASSQPFRLVYAGSLYGRDELTLLLDGLQLLLERRPALRERLRIDFMGYISAGNAQLLAARLPLVAPVVRHLGLRPRSETIALERAASAGLVLLAAGAGRSGVVPAKTYEYLGLDLPVLAMATEGDVRQILTELGWGVIADPTAAGVADGIERIIEEAPAMHGRTADPQRRYERRQLAGRLSALLDEVAGARGAPGSTADATLTRSSVETPPS